MTSMKDLARLAACVALPLVLPLAEAQAEALRFLIEVTPPNVAAPAGLTNNGRETFKTYLESGPNKAFAVSDTSRFGWATGRRTVEDARKAAIDYCASGTSTKCRIVNVNNQSAQ